MTYNVLMVTLNLTHSLTQSPPLQTPRAGSEVVRIDPLHFLAGCRTRRLNQV